MAGRPLVARVRTALTPWVRELHRQFLCRVFGMDLAEGAHISLSARLDKTNPRGIHVGEYSAITFESVILTHDFVNRKHRDVHIGKYCLIGARSLIYPGVTIGDHCIVSAMAVVMKDVPSNCIVAGNPARVIETGINTGKHGHRIPAAPTQAVQAQA